ncbi:hypothetical protein HZC34_06210 [Candidatus Saganbacteria bacterium]|nr:hypothetical protein [Candidatus Saganbacteria bacterium]
MTEASKNLILKKLGRIERLQEEILKDWSLVEDIILETTSKQLKKSIRQGRKDHNRGKAVPYRKYRLLVGRN